MVRDYSDKVALVGSIPTVSIEINLASSSRSKDRSLSNSRGRSITGRGHFIKHLFYGIIKERRFILKAKEKQEARSLRQECGWPLNKISTHLGVAKSSVSLWVRDIELTNAQLEELKNNHRYTDGRHKGALRKREIHLEERKKFQEFGRLKALEKDTFHQAGCMLYWAEGSKSKNMLDFTNSDPNMIKFFLNFLKTYYPNMISRVSFRVQWYKGNGFS